MPTVKDTLKEVRDRLEAERDKDAARRVFAGGNAAFDERKAGRPARSRRFVAGGNPHFDERGAPRRLAEN